MAKVTIEPGIGEVGSSGTAVVNPLSTTTYTLTASNGSGEVSQQVTIAISGVWEMQGVGHGVKNTCWTVTYASRFRPPDDRLWVGLRDRASYRSGLWFNVQSGMPKGAVISKATLQLYQYELREDWESPVGVHRMADGSWLGNDYATEVWTLGTDIPGFDLVPECTVVVSPGSRWVSWDVTSMVQSWVDGTYPNHGMMLTMATQRYQVARFYGSTYLTGAPLRPKLTIEYYVP